MHWFYRFHAICYPWKIICVLNKHIWCGTARYCITCKSINLFHPFSKTKFTCTSTCITNACYRNLQTHMLCKTFTTQFQSLEWRCLMRTHCLHTERNFSHNFSIILIFANYSCENVQSTKIRRRWTDNHWESHCKWISFKSNFSRIF